MKSVVWGLFGVLMSVVSAVAADWRDTALETAKAEKRVYDAIWSQEESFWVSVADDGTRQDGFADYICVTLWQSGKPEGEFVMVTVIDHAEMLKGKFRALGKHACR